jgi:hypothetical protein
MSILDSLLDVISKIFSTIWDFISDIFEKFWPIILIVVAIYFAPTIALWLGANGAPAWLTSAFTWLATSPITSLVTAVVDGGAGIITSGWNAFSAAELGTQMSILGGAAALLAPEETAELVADVVDAGFEFFTTAAGSSSVVLLGLAAAAAWFFFIRKKDEDDGANEPIEAIIDSDVEESVSSESREVITYEYI